MIDQLIAAEQSQQGDLLDCARDRADNNPGTGRRADFTSVDRPLKDLGHSRDRRLHMAPKRVLEERWLESKFSGDSRKAAEEIRTKGEIDVLGDHRSQITSKIAKIGRLESNDIIEQCISYKFGLRGPGPVDVPAIESRLLGDRLQGHPFVSGGDEHRTSGLQNGPSIGCVRRASRSSPLLAVCVGFVSHKLQVSRPRTILSPSETYGYTALLSSY